MSPKTRRWLTIGGGALVVLVAICVIVFITLTLLGPSTGNVYSTTVSSLDARRGLQGGAAPAEAPMPGFEAGGAGGGPGQPPKSAADQALPQATGVLSNTTNQQEGTARLIIRTGTASIAVENTYAAEKAIEAMVNQMAPNGAFVVSTNESPSGYGEAPYINMVIRVPADQFDQTMDAIAKMAAKGTVPTLSKTGEDVTDQYVDVKARLETMEAARDRLRQIMSEAQNTNDLLLAEQQLTQREADIEALKGRMQYLEQSAALSSITVSLQPYVLSQPVDTRWRPGETFREAVDRLLNSLRDFGDFLIIFVISVLPWLLLLALVVYGVYRFIRAQIRRSRANKPAASGEQE